FAEEGFGELLAAHMFDTPEPPSHHVPAISAATDELVLALLAKSPDGRVQTAMELVHRLTAIVGGTSEPRRSRDLAIVGAELALADPSPRNRRPKSTTLSSTASELTVPPVPRSRFGITLVVGAAIAAGIVSYVALSGRGDAPVESPPAREPPGPIAPSTPQVAAPASDPPGSAIDESRTGAAPPTGDRSPDDKPAVATPPDPRRPALDEPRTGAA